MEHFKFLTPKNIGEAFDLLEQYKDEKIKIIAGGTDLIPLLRNGVVDVDYFLDISNLGLSEIEEKDDCIKIGAMVTFSAIGKNKMLQEKLPSIVDSANQVGAAQTRTLATIGGNICSAVPSLDSAPALIALGASLVISSKDSERTVAMEEFFVAPRRNILEHGEILTEIIIPIPVKKHGVDFIKFGRRKALTLSMVNSAAYMALDDEGKIEDVKIVLGAVAITPVRAHKAEEKLIGKVPTIELFEEVSSDVDKEIRPITDLRASAEYRKHLAKVLVKRNLINALKQIQD